MNKQLRDKLEENIFMRSSFPVALYQWIVALLEPTHRADYAEKIRCCAIIGRDLDGLGRAHLTLFRVGGALLAPKRFTILPVGQFYSTYIRGGP